MSLYMPIQYTYFFHIDILLFILCFRRFICVFFLFFFTKCFLNWEEFNSEANYPSLFSSLKKDICEWNGRALGEGRRRDFFECVFLYSVEMCGYHSKSALSRARGRL